MSIPVLLMVFNRPNLTRQVLEAISEWDISCLFVSADGPRAHVPGDRELCEATRSLVLQSSWNFPIKSLFRDENMGCGSAVVSAIDWFFQFEESGIILEDDCVPHPSFLSFCQELLPRFRANPEIMMISGCNFLAETQIANDSYIFSRYTHTTGWATWKRAWELYDFKIESWPQVRDSDWLLEKCHQHSDAALYWSRVFDHVYEDQHDSWDYQWTYAVWSNNGLAITPGRNLITNIGFAAGATHSVVEPPWMRRINTEGVRFPLSHPEVIAANKEAERETDLRIFKTRSLWYRFGRLIAEASSKLGIEKNVRLFYVFLQKAFRRVSRSFRTD